MTLQKKRAGNPFMRIILISLSTAWAHWPAIAGATVLAAAAAMFGDKGYIIGITNEAQNIQETQSPAHAVEYLEERIYEYQQWQNENPNNMEYPADLALARLYLQLGQARQAAGMSTHEVMEAYDYAITSRESLIVKETLQLIQSNYPQEYRQYVINSFNNSFDQYSHAISIAIEFFTDGDWAGLQAFLDVAFDFVDDPTNLAIQLRRRITHRTSTAGEHFQEYCYTKPVLWHAIMQETAAQYEQIEHYRNAIQIYQEMGNSGPEGSLAYARLRICDCLHKGGHYQEAITALDQFIADYRATNTSLVIQAFSMKGLALVQLGEIDEAIDLFLGLMIEFPNAQGTPEANFFLGYCLMLQGNFDAAREALNLVVRDFPGSSYSSRAQLCLFRIDNMTD